MINFLFANAERIAVLTLIAAAFLVCGLVLVLDILGILDDCKQARARRSEDERIRQSRDPAEIDAVRQARLDWLREVNRRQPDDPAPRVGPTVSPHWDVCRRRAEDDDG